MVAGAAAALIAAAASFPALAVSPLTPELGGPGDDTVHLGPADDFFRALAGDDSVFGAAGDDILEGERGRDAVRGGSGQDSIDGGRGPDRLTGGPDADALRGRQGADFIDARDGTTDTRISGGPGKDVCNVDQGEKPSGCELVDAPKDEQPAKPTDPAEPQPVVPSEAYLNRNWQPTPFDTCPKALHDSYTVVGPDGKLYPTWHPPVTTDPETGAACTFGHEHGADPAGSDIHDWVAEQMAAPGHEDEAGLPFGYANEALIDYADENPGTVTRFEDHVGNKVDYANDVSLLDEAGRNVTATGEGGATVKVSCDFLFKVHMGTHSADALSNNAHELLYAARCNDGTELVSTTLTRFGDANEFNRSCAPGTTVSTSGSPLPDGIGGQRLIPDRGCIEQFVLVPPTGQSDIWALYENWISENRLTTADGRTLAEFDPWFAVNNPSRHQVPGGPVGRPLAAAWETDAGDGGTANRPPWAEVSGLAPFEFRDPRSPFDGAQREFYLRETRVLNTGGPRRWYTDPYGGNGSTEPFPGSICQIVSPTDNSARPELKLRLFKRGTDYGAGNGVHPPN